MKSYNIIVKYPSQLHQYGFVKISERVYEISYKLRAEREKLHIISASTPVIKVICEMYKDGVIAFEKYDGAKQPFMLSREEAELIRKFRENKEKWNGSD